MIRTYKTRSGPMLALENDLYITKSLELYGEYNRSEWLMLKQAIRPGMTVLEIGANMGSHSVDIARACAPGPFYAFEPQQRLFQILCGNLALNDITNAFAYPDACGDIEGEAVVPPINYAKEDGNYGGISLREAGSPGTTVRVRTVDGLKLAACGLLKIDVEGFEARVLKGARETIRRCRPVIYIENDRAEQQQEIISIIADLDYDLYWHCPRLFDPGNFNGNQQNIFGAVVSINMLCLPKEREAIIQGATAIDPANWTCPARLEN